MASNDPLLQPYQLKHLTLKNRVMSTSHEPAYSEDGMPKERYRLYHAEKARGGMALTMTAGSAIVSRDSPAAFGNLHLYDDAIVPWLSELAEACHEHDCKVMIQITHLGRRTGWNKADWLPVLSASPVREPAHRAFPKAAEDWDIERIVKDYASAAQRCHGLRPSDRRFLVAGNQPSRRRIRRLARQQAALHQHGARRRARGCRREIRRRHPHGGG
jgi:N-methyl-L-proline demethylase